MGSCISCKIHNKTSDTINVKKILIVRETFFFFLFAYYIVFGTSLYTVNMLTNRNQPTIQS